MCKTKNKEVLAKINRGNKELKQGKPLVIESLAELLNKKWDTLEEKVKCHARIPLKQKLEFLRQMLEFSSRHQLKLRRKFRLAVR